MTSTDTPIQDYWTVSTTTGRIKGHAGTGVTAFRGIPYAEPPVGPLRFRRAQPIAAWSGVLDARTNGEYCYQYRNKSIGWIGSEDCLWLNVVVPRTDGGSHSINKDANRPIAIHLHGGSNVHGSAADPLRSGEYFATATDSIYVGVNYRLGMFGQLYFGEDITKSNPGTASSGADTANETGVADSTGAGATDAAGATSADADGSADARLDTNPGLSDIITAIKWIKANAEAFGGDPNRITIFGESSGGAMVTALMTSPHLDGVIAGAIAQSPAGAMVHSLKTALYWRRQALEALGKIRDEAGLASEEEELGTWDLINATTEELGRVTEELTAHNMAEAPGLAGGFAPLIDGDILPAHPMNAGSQRALPLMIGYNRDEYQMMRWEPLRTKDQTARTLRLASNIAGEAAEHLLAHYGYGSEDGETRVATRGGALGGTRGGKRRDLRTRRHNRRYNASFIGDAIFVAPTYRIASNHPGENVWLYRLDLTTPSLKLSGLGATHALDLPLLFQRVDTDKGKIALALGGASQLQRTSQAMLGRWKRFLHELDPGFAPFGTTLMPEGDAGSTAGGAAGAAGGAGAALPAAGALAMGTMQIFDGNAFETGEKTVPAELTAKRLAWEETNLVLE